MRSPLALPVVAARHLLWDRRDRMRALVWGERPGYELRVPPPNRIEVVEWERKRPPAPSVPAAACVGILAHSPALAACARLLGLSVIEPVGDDPILLLERALRQRWGLLSSSAETLRALRPDRWQALSQFVHRGGTLFLHGVSQAVDLRELSRGLNVEPVRAEPLVAPSRAMLFPGAAADFAGLLAGVRIETSVQGCRLRGAARALALSLAQGDSHPSVVELTAGRGRVILSSFPGSLEGELATTFGPENSPLLLPPLMALKRTFGQTAWHPPALLANFTVDDPALREGLLGLPYSKVVRLADEHQFHVTVATIPAELGLAQHDVISHLRSHPQAVSACYHGWNHDGYEFYRSSGRHLRFRTRSLAEQREGLRRAVEQGRRFAERTGYELDRVMVFPHGLGPAAILPDLHRLGFVASCNLDNRYPLETPVPDDPSLGLRPADTAWWGFPLLWRREIGDPGYLLDLFLGRPALTFEHARPLGRDLMPFVSRAEEINRISGRAVSWRSLDEIARHAYWQRLDPAGGWQVMMTTNEACLHNPYPNPRTFTVCRPHGPTGSRLHTDEATLAAGERIRVTVPAESVATVQLLLGKDSLRLPPRRGCSLYPAELFAETPVTR
jgi:hypothetical protein